jgi:hypothetical protein
MDSKQRRLDGLAIAKADPRRTRPVTIEVLIAAWRRGWNSEQIRFAAGVSHQTVVARIRAYEKRYGTVPHIERPIAWAVKFPWRCAYCDKLEWSSRVRLKMGDLHFCNMRCNAAFRRLISDAQVEQAINLRRVGNSWSNISAIIGHPIQCIQSRIWKYLYVTNRLNRSVVEAIWVAGHVGQGRPASWRWLELNTGLYCTENGTELGERYRSRRGKSGHAWGNTILGQ